MECWNVICSGPSLSYWSNEYLCAQSGVKVGVNRSFRKGIPLDYWCMIDLPAFERYCAGMTQAEYKSLSANTVLWCPSRWATDMRRSPPEVIQFYNMLPKEYFLSNPREALQESMPLPYAHIDWRYSSATAALAMIVKRFDGTGCIQIFGMDMTGHRHFNSEPVGGGNTRGPLIDQRWDGERKVIKSIIEACAQQGIEITLRTHQRS